MTPATPGRYPVRRTTDGDFLLEEIIGGRGTEEPASLQPLPGLADAALRTRFWSPGEAGYTGFVASPTVSGVTLEREVELLHRFEISSISHPPVATHVDSLTKASAEAWLTLADHWIALSETLGDLRFLNGACKLLGAVWSLDPVTRWPDRKVMDHVAVTAKLIARASAKVAAPLEARQIPAVVPASCPPEVVPPGAASPVVIVLAGAGSRSPSRLLRDVRQRGGGLEAICWFGAEPGTAPPSGYSAAWYPPEYSAAQPDSAPVDIPEKRATDWDEAIAVLRRLSPDLVVLLGMPIVPPGVLEIPRLGTINAHNGALPGYRGMDAVGWALLNGDPITCSVHIVTAGVDAGPVLLERSVPFPPGSTLRSRVKDAQLELLTAVITQIESTGRLPTGREQAAEHARQFYRLHPHLKRILDASPYGKGDPS